MIEHSRGILQLTGNFGFVTLPTSIQDNNMSVLKKKMYGPYFQMIFKINTDSLGKLWLAKVAV